MWKSSENKVKATVAITLWYLTLRYSCVLLLSVADTARMTSIMQDEANTGEQPWMDVPNFCITFTHIHCSYCIESFCSLNWLHWFISYSFSQTWDITLKIKPWFHRSVLNAQHISVSISPSVLLRLWECVCRTELFITGAYCKSLLVPSSGLASKKGNIVRERLLQWQSQFLSVVSRCLFQWAQWLFSALWSSS